MLCAKSGQLPANFDQTVPPSLRITVPPCVFFGKGVQFRLDALSFFVFFLALDQDMINEKSPSYSLNMKGLSFFWRLLS